MAGAYMDRTASFPHKPQLLDGNITFALDHQYVIVVG